MTARAEYQRGIMDAISNPHVREVVVMSSAQVGKSEILLNVAGYYISQDPAPIMLFQPTISMAEAFSKDRLATMIRDTPSISDLITKVKWRDSANTILHKNFPGGHITLAGAESPSSLASRPVRVVLFDEVDRYPASAGKEGDPVNLGKKRTATFWNRRVIMVSTPTVKGASRIEAAYNETDQRRFFVPCVHCGHMDHLQWSQVKWRDHDPDTAVYACAECGGIHDDKDRARMVKQGEWRATSEATQAGHVGFHLNELYSPWRKLSQIVGDFLAAKKNPETLKTWINTSLGETWEAGDLAVLSTDLAARAEPYELGTVPLGACALTAGVDVQDDRIEFTVYGWGEGEEFWVCDYGVIVGNPAQPEIWGKLRQVINTPLTNEAGHHMEIRMTALDTGGHHTQMAYKFCRENSNNVMAIKGSSTPGRPVVSRPSKQDVNINGATVENGVQLWLVGTDTAKHTIYSRLALKEPGPGFGHFSQALPVEFYHQLTAERLVTKYFKGVAKVEWRKSAGVRNEALDMAVYAYAAATRIGIPRMPPDEWKRARDILADKPDDFGLESKASEQAPATVAAPAPPTPRKSGNQWLARSGRKWL